MGLARMRPLTPSPWKKNSWIKAGVTLRSIIIAKRGGKKLKIDLRKSDM